MSERARLSLKGRPGGGWHLQVQLELPVMEPFYWLNHCHGFLVDSADGEVGVVDEVLPTDGSQAEAIVVAIGWFRRRRVTVGVDDVEEILPHQRRLAVRQPLGAKSPTTWFQRILRLINPSSS